MNTTAIIIWGSVNVAANLLAAWWIADAGCRHCRYQHIYTLGSSILLIIALRRVITTMDAVWPGLGWNLFELERYVLPGALSLIYVLLAHEIRRVSRPAQPREGPE